MKYIYIAGPYTSDPEAHTANTIKAGQRLITMGYIPFVPHLYHFWHKQIPGSYEQWMELDFAWLRRCDAMIRLFGISDGADREVQVARDIGMPVFCGIADFITNAPTMKIT